MSKREKRRDVERTVLNFKDLHTTTNTSDTHSLQGHHEEATAVATTTGGGGGGGGGGGTSCIHVLVSSDNLANICIVPQTVNSGRVIRCHI